MMNCLRKLILLIPTNKILKKILIILIKWYLIPVYLLKPKTLIDPKKINFDGRIAVTSKKLWIKKQVENAIDLGDKNGEKKFKTYFI